MGEFSLTNSKDLPITVQSVDVADEDQDKLSSKKVGGGFFKVDF